MKRWIISLIIAVVVLVPLELWLVSGEGHGALPWSGFTGFFVIFGFIGCLVLIGFSKLIGHYWLQHKEDYYSKHYSRDDDDK